MIINRNRFILSIFLTTTCGLVYAQCFPQGDNATCRFAAGDEWCAENGGGNPYAYSNECLKGTEQAFKQQAEQAEKKLNVINDFVVAGISIGMSKVNVKKFLGNPRNKKKWKGFTTNFIDFNYIGLTVTLSGEGGNEGVFGILIESAKYATNRGLRVGDSVKKVLKIYKNPAIRDEQSLEYGDVYGYEGGGLLRIRIKKNRVEWIYAGYLND